MSHASSRIKNQTVIARRKVLRKREQRQAGVPVVVAKIRGEYGRQASRDAHWREKTLRFAERYGVSGNELHAEFAKLRPELLPAFRSGVSVLHKISDTGKVGKLIRRVESGPDAGKWLVRWDRAKTNAGPYVERNLVVV